MKTKTVYISKHLAEKLVTENFSVLRQNSKKQELSKLEDSNFDKSVHDVNRNIISSILNSQVYAEFIAKNPNLRLLKKYSNERLGCWVAVKSCLAPKLSGGYVFSKKIICDFFRSFVNNVLFHIFKNVSADCFDFTFESFPNKSFYCSERNHTDYKSYNKNIIRQKIRNSKVDVEWLPATEAINWLKNIVNLEKLSDCIAVNNYGDLYLLVNHDGKFSFYDTNDNCRQSINANFVCWVNFSSEICNALVSDENTDSGASLEEIGNILNNNNILQSDFFLKTDNIRVNLPLLREDDLYSSSGGSFEVFCPDNPPDAADDPYVKIELDKECTVADPWNFVRENETVAIDFGTSSTVVAFCDKQGKSNLLRMNFSDKFDDTRYNPYENPTVLQFNDIESFKSAWYGEKFRPLTRWNSVYSSFDGKSQLIDHASSGISNIKTWAWKKNSSKPVILEDNSLLRTVIELSPLAVEDAANDSDLGDWKNRPLDPIEIYGYYIGLCLNTQTVRDGMIFLNYNLTFPVKFDKETKKRITQGLRRGLLRSLPPSLIYSEKWNDSLFHVNSTVSEPVALVASAMPQLKLDDFANIKSYPFAVFDFGGGTTDFAAGFYRVSTEDEFDEYGADKIVEIIRTSGDPELGGERLLDLLFYEVLRRNADKLQKEGVSFTLPNGFDQFPGSERLWGRGACAHGNTSKLREALRPIWEEQEDIVKETIVEPGSLSIQLRNDTGFIPLDLDVDVEEARQSIQQRILKTVAEFFNFLRLAFKEHCTNETHSELHVVFSGNSSRSSFLKTAFESIMNVISERNRTNADNCTDESESTTPFNLKDKIKLHYELGDSEYKDSGVTLKTCVALGLLRILRGDIYPIDVETEEYCDEETPFRYYVGTFRFDNFIPEIRRNINYNEWYPFSKVRKSINGGLKIGWNLSDLAAEEGKIKADNCSQTIISFDSKYVGCEIRFRAVGPAVGEFGCFGEDDSEPLQIVKVNFD